MLSPAKALTAVTWEERYLGMNGHLLNECLIQRQNVYESLQWDCQIENIGLHLFMLLKAS